ncbi:MAG: hypothetical protein MOGMAGMI_02474 [Candidatus Omnitrophica bacterium]|nr:hypothetical protein [Candidatus Omnitrophota bacterium]
MSATYNGWNPLAVKVTVTTGTTAGADITVTGITTSDILLAVIEEDGTSGVTADNLLSEASITDTNDVQCSTTNTTGKVLTIWWLDVSALSEA